MAKLVTASKDLGLARVDQIKPELAFRRAYVQLMSLVGDPAMIGPSHHVLKS